MRVGKGQVGFDVQDGSAIHQIGTFNVDDWALGCVKFNLCYPDGGQTYVVGAKG